MSWSAGWYVRIFLFLLIAIFGFGILADVLGTVVEILSRLLEERALCSNAVVWLSRLSGLKQSWQLQVEQKFENFAENTAVMHQAGTLWEIITAPRNDQFLF